MRSSSALACFWLFLMPERAASPRGCLYRRRRGRSCRRGLGAGAVVAELGLVLALDDGEGGEDVGGVVPVEAVEVEVEGVEAGSEVAAGFLVPGEGWAVVAEVAGEGGHVVGGVGEAEDVVADEVGGGAVAEATVVCVGRE